MREFLNSFRKLEFDKVKSCIGRYTTSPLGKELVDRLAPSSSIDDVRSGLSVLSEMKKLLEQHEHPPLDNVPDVRIALQHSSIDNFTLAPEELHKIRLLLETAKKVTAYFKQKGDDYPLLHSKIQGIKTYPILEYNIRQAIDDDETVKDTATKELSAIRKRIVERKDQLRKQLESILKSLVGKEWAQEEIITTRDGRMVIPVKSEHKNRVHGFIHSSSSSGATVFIEPSETLDGNNDLRTLQFQEQREVEKVLRGLTEQVREAREGLEDELDILGFMDFIIAKAKYSIEVLGAEPIVLTHGVMRLVGARHPLLLERHKRGEVVPLSIEVGERATTIIITGPNAGGKSVALKTVGILSVLLQSGCHIPVSPESEFPIYSDIFFDIGDEQSIENDLSSFSSHLSNLIQIIENTNATSLVLLDEIGSGTDPVEGSSLAAAVLEHLTQVKSFTIATTHHGALKSFAFETEGIENAAMEFDNTTLRPTYQFRLGIPGSSYAIEMAERMLLPKGITQRARELRGKEGNDLERLILDLEHQSQQFKKDLESVRSEKLQLNSLIKLYQNRITTLEKELKLIKLKAIREAQEITSRASAAVENAVREIKEHSADKNVITSARQKLGSLQSEVEQFKRTLEQGDIVSQEFLVGDKVRLKDSNTFGEVIERVDDNHYTLLVGGIRVKVGGRQLEHSSSEQATHSPQAPEIVSPTVAQEVDLRGMYGDEAVNAIDKFLDSAILSGLHRVDIIHGKGTGSLRKRVSQYLEKHPAVKSFRLGEWNEGGGGVTVVELK